MEAQKKTFLLTHPVWDVTDKVVCKRVYEVISTHTSRVGCDFYRAVFPEGSFEFLLTHPVWDVTAIYSIFQSHYSHILQDGPIIHLELY